MGRGKPVELANRTFDKRGDATTFFASMLQKYKPGDRVSDEDALDLGSLFERHREYVEKSGCGISHFEVQDGDYATQCFRVVRTDGTWARFSYPACIAPDTKRG